MYKLRRTVGIAVLILGLLLWDVAIVVMSNASVRIQAAVSMMVP